MNSKLKDKLLDLKQEHIIKHYDGLEAKEKEALVNNLNEADFEKLASAFDQGLLSSSSIKIDRQDFTKKEDIYSKELFNDGLKIIEERRAAVLIMAGGMGSRLGFDAPKGAFILANNKSVFEIHIEKLKKLHELTKYSPFIIIMCSDLNIDATVKFFDDNKYFDYPKDRIVFIKQGNIPACDDNYKILLETKTSIKQVPDGNGGVFDALKKSGSLEHLKKEGVKWLQIAGVDNVLLKILDPVFLAFAEKSETDIASKSVARMDEHEKVGIFALKDSRPSVLEYTEISQELLKKKTDDGEYFLSEANIASHLFNIESDKFEKCLDLPFHKAHKKIAFYDGEKIVNPEKENAYKYEQFIFDAFKNFDKMAVLRVNREDEFSALKNKEGKDSIESARNSYLSSLEKSDIF